MKKVFRLEKKLIVVEKLKKSGATMFKNLEVGDVVEFAIPLCGVGHCSNGSRAAKIQVVNLSTGERTVTTFNRVESIMSSFIFKEIQ